MYTVVLMAALTTSPAVPDFGHRRRGHGCCGGGYAGCCGGGYGGGCCGGYGGGYGGGCCGGGYGGGYGGGCCGGGGYGGVAYGGMGYGDGYYASMPYTGTYYGGVQYSTPSYGVPYTGGYYQGGYNQGGYYQGGTERQGEAVPPAGTQRQGTGTGGQQFNNKGNRPPAPGGSANRDGGQVLAPTPAQILVSLPANATLQFDGVPTRLVNATVRTFNSPPLEPGQQYFYTMTAQIQRDGRPVTVTRRIDVQAGQTTRIAVDFPAADVTARR